MNIASLIKDLKSNIVEDVYETLSLIGQNIINITPTQRIQCYKAMFDVAENPEKNKLIRVGAVAVLNVLYPNCNKSERAVFRRRMRIVAKTMKHGSLLEFFNETVPDVSEWADN